MITLGDITRKDTRYNYVKDDVVPYVIRGTVQFDINNRVIDLSGVVYDTNNNYVANFHSYNSGDNAKYNLTDCSFDKLKEVANLLEVTVKEIKDLVI